MPIHGTIGAVSGSFQIENSGAAVTTVLDEDNMASNSATALATQQSIKAYVDATSAPTLGAVGNVNTTDTTKAAGHVLVWDNTQSRWENAAIAGTSNEVDITLGDLIIIPPVLISIKSICFLIDFLPRSISFHFFEI